MCDILIDERKIMEIRGIKAIMSLLMPDVCEWVVRRSWWNMNVDIIILSLKKKQDFCKLFIITKINAQELVNLIEFQFFQARAIKSFISSIIVIIIIFNIIINIIIIIIIIIF